MKDAALEDWPTGKTGPEKKGVGRRERGARSTHSTELVEALLEAANAAAFILDDDGSIAMANARGRTLEASEKRLLPFLALAPATPPSELATWSLGSLRGWRRRFVDEGGEACSLVVVECVEAALDETVARSVEEWGLTTRQAYVLRYVLDGMSNKEIADRTRLAVRTVEVHITAILVKASVDSRARLIAKTWNRGRSPSRS
jgi:DNA-binding CsgD family transcriptional regulator